MKKKFGKKLALNRETVHHFEYRSLQNVVGGASLANSCDPVSNRICPSENCTAYCTPFCSVDTGCC